jgi:integrase
MADIDRRERGGRVTYRVRYRSPDGRQREKNFTRLADAKRWMTDNAHAAQHGAWVDPNAGRTTFADQGERWLAAQAHLRPSTIRLYRWALDRVAPTLGPVPLNRIDTLTVREVVADLTRSGLSPSRVRNAYGVVSAVLSSGVEAGKLARNPAVGVKLPRRQRAEMLMLDAAEVEALADAIDPRSRVLVLTAAYTGLRAGELAGLKVGRLNLLKREAAVVEALTEVGGKLVTVPTKSGERRTVPLPKFLADLLGAHLADRPHGPEALVFTSPEGGPIRQGTFMARTFRPAVEAAGLPDGFRVHDLRHSAASLAISSGANVLVVSKMLGHADPSITLKVYGHLYPSDLAAVADRLDAIHTAATQSAPAGGAIVGQTATVRPIAAGQRG